MTTSRRIFIQFLIGLSLFAVTAAGQDEQKWTEQTQLEFLKRHWNIPVRPQGRAPAGWSESEISLSPDSCGGCHPQQFKDWKTTVHSRAVGPGLLGQMPTLLRKEPATTTVCYSCHAPLTEQQELVSVGVRMKKNTQFDETLQRQGLTCAGCHVRAYQRFGPPRRDGSLANLKPSARLPHGGAIRTPAFERAEFCAGCHQFEPNGNTLNGKPLENTYNEWKNSPYAAQGIQCQQCHMTDRRHLWRGIHDREMVRNGVNVDLRLNRQSYAKGETLEATLILTNSGVGHYFPTYVTPKIVLRMELIDAAGHVVSNSTEEDIVGRQVTLSLDGEIADTRIAPKAEHRFRYVRTVDRTGLRIRAQVIVCPDDFYARFYEAKLAGRLSNVERRLLLQALNDTRISVYKIFEKEVALL